MSERKTVAVVGTGSVGAALGRGWVESGYDVVFGSRSADGPDAALERLVAETGARLASPQSAVSVADVVVLAVPGSVAVAVVSDLAAAIEGRDTPLVDCTNGPVPTGADSLGEAVAAALPGGSVAKAFNTIGANRMRSPAFPDGTASMLVCGDDAAVDAATELATALDFDVVDAGDLTAARHLEAVARAWIHLAGVHGRDIGFRLLGVQ
jgi:hypothetical protein